LFQEFTSSTNNFTSLETLPLPPKISKIGKLALGDLAGRIGWRTPTIMIASYLLGMAPSADKLYNTHSQILAIVVAFANFGLFQYLNGKFADGPNRIMPQSYVSTSSRLLATLSDSAPILTWHSFCSISLVFAEDLDFPSVNGRDSF